MARGALRLDGPGRKIRNLAHLRWLVEVEEPNGWERAQLIKRYSYDCGLTEKKAVEHLDLSVELNELLEDDLRIYLGTGKTPRPNSPTRQSTHIYTHKKGVARSA
jgi:hypothetical protein